MQQAISWINYEKVFDVLQHSATTSKRYTIGYRISISRPFQMSDLIIFCVDHIAQQRIHMIDVQWTCGAVKSPTHVGVISVRTTTLNDTNTWRIVNFRRDVVWNIQNYCAKTEIYHTKFIISYYLDSRTKSWRQTLLTRRNTQKLPCCQAIVWITEWGYRTEPNSIVINIMLGECFIWYAHFYLTCFVLFTSVISGLTPNVLENHKRLFTFRIISWSSFNNTRPDSQLYMLPILCCQFHSCWCPGDLRTRGINKHGIDTISRNILFLASEELIWRLICPNN